MQAVAIRQPGSSIFTEGFVMTRVTSNRSAPSDGRVNPADRSPFPAIAEAWRELRKGLLDSYRPDLHYMRGPGPKWREKHGTPHATRCDAAARTLRGVTP
jgi:hypothetical protein